MSWQEAVVRLIPTAVAAVAGFIAWREYRRKVREEIKSDRRREQDRWWGIVQWCIDKTDSAERAERITGWYFLPTILGLLSDVEGDSPLSTRYGILPKSLKRVSSTNLPRKKKEAMLHETSARLAFYEPDPEVRRTRARAAAEIQRIILERFPHRREELLQRSADYEYARAQRVNEEKAEPLKLRLALRHGDQRTQ